MTRTGTATATRWFTLATAGLAALALLVASGSSAATVTDSPDSGSASMAAESHAARTFRIPTTKPRVVKTVKSAVVSTANTAAVAADYSSIFATQIPALANAGWSGCPAPITWSVDASNLSADEATEQIANLQWALDQWTLATGLSFQFAGTTELAYNDAAFSLTPTDGTAASARNIFLAFVNDADSDRLGGGTVGLGGPSQVWQSSKEITGGTAVFRTDHVAKAGVNEARSLYLHELGHVLGLAHAAETANIMYPVVTDHLELGAGDTAGARSMTKPCTEAA